MYEKAVGVYLELSSELDPIALYNTYNDLVADAIDKNRDFLEGINNINQHNIKVEFLYHFGQPKVEFLYHFGQPPKVMFWSLIKK